jgi:ribose 5-phosphate isomerase B
MELDPKEHVNRGFIIAIASDHAGFELKQKLITKLKSVSGRGHHVIDLGPDNMDRVDYPDYATKVAAAVIGAHSERGILICGSGVGMSIQANRYQGVRCALVSDPETARLSRAHNNSNMLALGARLTGEDMAWACVDAWLKTGFEFGRHEARIAKMDPGLWPPLMVFNKEKHND